MLLTNTENIPGQNYQIISLVSGCYILARHIGKDIGSGFRNLVGGEMKAYTEMLDEAQVCAVNIMTEKAAKMGADAVVNIRFSTSSITQGGAEILVAGTAVKFV